MSSNRRGGGRWKKNHKERDGAKAEEGDHQNNSDPQVDNNSPIVQAFRVFQEELNCRNDRFERIVKLSRDITIESKRVIFLLQRIIGSDDPEKVLKEAKEKIDEINTTKFFQIAKELDGQDPYQYLRAYTNGLQEYIEAVTFFYYLAEHHLVNLEKVQNPLIFKFNSKPDISTDQKPNISTDQKPDISTDQKPDISTDQKPDISTDQKPEVLCEPEPQTSNTIDSGGKSHIQQNSDENVSTSGEDCTKPDSGQPVDNLSVHIPATEYMMGVADFTGELMRMAITSVGAGDLETPKVVANMMRTIHNAFSIFDHTSREMRRKTTVLKQSLQKVETACYALTVRGSEIPKHMLKDVFSNNSLGNNYMTDDVDIEYDTHDV